MRKVAVIGSVALLCAGIAWAQEATRQAQKAPTPNALKAEVEALKAPRVAWREIAWKSCLLEGLAESRAKKKPVLLWVFIDRPPDDAEGLLYREIGRSRPAPQGICVVNTAGKVLNWALMFDDDRSVLAF